MSRITQELRELAEIANILSKGNGDVTVRITREPEYSGRGIYKHINDTLAAKIQVLAEIKPEEYRAIVLGSAETQDKAEPLDSVEQDTIDTTKEPGSEADPRD